MLWQRVSSSGVSARPGTDATLVRKAVRLVEPLPGVPRDLNICRQDAGSKSEREQQPTVGSIEGQASVILLPSSVMAIWISSSVMAGLGSSVHGAAARVNGLPVE